MWALYLLGLIIFEAIADIFVKQHSITKTWQTFVIAILCYVIANISWLISMRYNSQLGIGANIFSVSTGILAVAIGCFYGEVLTTKHIIGIVLGVISLILLVS